MLENTVNKSIAHGQLILLSVGIKHKLASSVPKHGLMRSMHSVCLPSPREVNQLFTVCGMPTCSSAIGVLLRPILACEYMKHPAR